MYICPENCLTDLPVVTVNGCNPVILKSGINFLAFAKKSAAAFTNWTSPTEWANRLSNSSTSDDAIRFVLGTGNMPAGTKQEITYQVNKKRTIGKTRTLQFIIEEANDTIHQLIQAFECGGEYKVWFGTVGGQLYGGNNGIAVTIDGNVVLGGGENDYEQRILDLSWDSQQSMDRTLSPIDGLTDNLPVSYDSVLTFLASSTDAKEGVTGTIVGTDPVTKFEFNKLTVISGTPVSMSIELNGSEVMTVDTTTDYVGRSFRYTAANGSQYTGTIINGTVEFTSTSS
ncbi:MAG: hypothetical protein ACTHLE_04155 [Agriterribacter sp.]